MKTSVKIMITIALICDLILFLLAYCGCGVQKEAAGEFYSREFQATTATFTTPIVYIENRILWHGNQVNIIDAMGDTLRVDPTVRVQIYADSVILTDGVAKTTYRHGNTIH